MAQQSDIPPPEVRRRREEFRIMRRDTSRAVQELAVAVGLPASKVGLDDPEALLDAVDAFLARMDEASLSATQRAWVAARLSLFAGEYLVRQFGGTWFLQEDSSISFYLRAVVGGFHADASLIVDPTALAARALKKKSNGLRAEVAQLGLDAHDTAPQVDIGGLTGRHRSLAPKIRCTCGRFIWDLSGYRIHRAAWLTDRDADAAEKELTRLIALWADARSDDARLQRFVETELGLPPGVNMDQASVLREIVVGVIGRAGATMFECDGCGRLWIEDREGSFTPYSTDRGARDVLAGRADPDRNGK
jgi:hypothetical protein